MTPAVKQQAVAHLRTALGMSERRPYAVVEADRTRMRYRSCRGMKATGGRVPSARSRPLRLRTVIVDDHQQVIVAEVSTDRIGHPVTARLRAEQHQLEDAARLAVRGVAALQRVLELGEQDARDQLELMPFGQGQMIEVAAHLDRA